MNLSLEGEAHMESSFWAVEDDEDWVRLELGSIDEKGM